MGKQAANKWLVPFTLRCVCVSLLRSRKSAHFCTRGAALVRAHRLHLSSGSKCVLHSVHYTQCAAAASVCCSASAANEASWAHNFSARVSAAQSAAQATVCRRLSAVCLPPLEIALLILARSLAAQLSRPTSPAGRDCSPFAAQPNGRAPTTGGPFPSLGRPPLQTASSDLAALTAATLDKLP